jgi:hypothetical protein
LVIPSRPTTNKREPFQARDFLRHPTNGLYMVSIDHGIRRPFIWNVLFCLWIVVRSFKVAWVILPVHPDPLVVMWIFCMAVGCGKGLKGLLLVWRAILWLIWRGRNDSIFSPKPQYYYKGNLYTLWVFRSRFLFVVWVKYPLYFILKYGCSINCTYFSIL